MGRCPLLRCVHNTMEEHTKSSWRAGKAKSAPVGMSRKPQRIREITSDGNPVFHRHGGIDRFPAAAVVAGSLVLVGGAPASASPRFFAANLQQSVRRPSGAVRLARKASGS